MADAETGREANAIPSSQAPEASRRPLEAGDGLRALVADAVDDGLRRVEIVAWRDLDDPEAGGSELHVHEIARRWASAGLLVAVRTSAVRGAPAGLCRDGYRVVRRWGRYAVFPATAGRGLVVGSGRSDGLVEVWNGMPFFSPLWRRRSRVVLLHHVHAEMWHMVLTPGLARAGEVVERRLAPPLYRHVRVVTLSESSRREIQSMLGLEHVAVVPPGIDPRFTPGPGRSPTPLVLAVGRMVPVKRLPVLIDVLARVRRHVPRLQAVIVGEGYARADVEAAVRALGAEHWIAVTGRCAQEELVGHYRRAWVLTGASRREGWGMTVTEAAACGTPAVVTRIPGHQDAVVDGVSGLLAGDETDLAAALTRVLTDRVLRQRLASGALARVMGLSWEATATGTLQVLLAEHRRTRRPRPTRQAGAGRTGPGSRPRPEPAPAR